MTTATMTVSDEIKTLESSLTKLSNLRCKELKDIRTVLDGEWVAAGGCTKCNGRGWVVLWDTLDSLSGCYAEYGNCDCGCNGSNPRPNLLTKYDSLRGVKEVIFMTPLYMSVIAPIDTEIDTVRNQIELLKNQAKVHKGDNVRVIRGRKTPKGTEGKVFWLGPDRYSDGMRCGFKSSDGATHWVALDYVSKITG